jgi:Cu/Ag efflux pump CusA
LIVRGSLERLSPVLMTAVCAGLALTPLLFGAAEPGREILRPFTVTIFDGACRKSNPTILVMQPAQDWKAKNTPCSLNGPR